MKPTLLFLFFSFFQLHAQNSVKSAFTDAELAFIKQESIYNAVYFIDNPRVLIAFNESDFSLFKEGKKYGYATEFYSESNYKFKILDHKNKLVGSGTIDNTDKYDVVLYFESSALLKIFGPSVRFSVLDKMTSK